MCAGSADIFQNQHFQKVLSGILSVSNSLEPDQARRSVGPDLGPNCLQRLSADDTYRQSQQENMFQDLFSANITNVLFRTLK